MPFFRRKEKTSSRPPTAPEIPKLVLTGDQSLADLGAGLDEHSHSTSTTSNGTGKHANGHSASIPPSAANTTVSQKARNRSIAETNSSLQQSRKYDTINHLANIKPQDSRHTIGHNPKSGSLARSMSQGAVPYHLPWTRDLVHDDSGGMGSFDQNNNQQSIPASSSRRKMGPPPSAANNSHGLAALFNRPTDFRISPNSIPQPTASQRRQVIDTARSQSLRRAKAPAELNLMTFGATGTGKTSFIRTLLATCDLSLCTDEAKRAASFFGISSDYKHSTHDMDPIMPLRTKQYEILQGIDLHPNSLIPISALEAGIDSTGRHSSIRNRPGSMFSTRTSNTSGFGSGRLQLSVCDTPGIDFELEDDFEIERKVNAGLRHLEFKLGKTLSEENKVQRQPRGDGLMHLIVYFIDPRFLIDRVHTRKAKILRARYATAQSNKNVDLSQQQKRTRSASMVGGSTNSQAVFSGNLNKQAHTAQLRQSMEQIQARSTPTKPKHGAKGSVSTIEMPSNNSDAPPKESVEEETLDDDDGVEGLSQRELSIISRLSERANVLPIIAKADTLTTAQLEEVRTAVRNSIIKANIDLGAFEVDGVRRKKRIRAREPNPISSINQRVNLEESTPESSGDIPFNTEPVKVIRIRSRRSYSAHSGERMAASTSGHSMSGNNVFDDPADEGNSNLGHTSPLFDELPKDGDEQDEEDIKLAPELVSKMIPFSLFVPEPIRVRSKQASSTRSTISAQKSGAPARKASMNSIAENLPPVPKLPNDIASLRKGLGEGRPGTGSTISQSDLLTKTNGEEEMETLESKVSNTENDSGNDQQGGRQSLESASTHPATNGAKVNTEGDMPISTHTSSQAGLSSFTPPPPPQSMRFVREFRFGNANVLDGRQCDFNVMRTCILGSHVEKMREVTNDRYERFRSQQLEFRRQETIKQTSANALPSTTTTTTTTSAATTSAIAPAGPN